MLATLDEEPDLGARAACAACFLLGERLWQIVRPGALLVPDAPRAPSTIYGGSDRRPWVVIGESDAGDLLAAPLNDAGAGGADVRWGLLEGCPGRLGPPPNAMTVATRACRT